MEELLMLVRIVTRCGTKYIRRLINYSQQMTHFLAVGMSAANGVFSVSDDGVVDKEVGCAQWVSGTHRGRSFLI